MRGDHRSRSSGPPFGALFDKERDTELVVIAQQMDSTMFFAIEVILLEPEGEQLKNTLKGDLAGMLSAARDSKRSPDTGDLMVQIKLVAGARNQRYLQLLERRGVNG